MSLKIVYNSEGYPAHVIMQGGRVVMSQSGSGKTSTGSNDVMDVVPNLLEEGVVGRWVPWGDGNDLPRDVTRQVRRSGVASRAIRLKVQNMYGQKLVPCKVVDFDPNSGKETLEYVKDKEIHDFLRRSNIDHFRASCLLDYEMLGNVFPILWLNDDRSEIVMVSHDKAAKFRYAPFDQKLGRIDSVFRSANWPNPGPDQYDEIKVINSRHWYYDVDRIKADSETRYVYPITALDILNDYYAVQSWMAIYFNKTLDNVNSIPEIEASIIKNIWTIRYHVEINRDYWEYMHPGFAGMDKAQRDAIVNEVYSNMNTFLSGKDNQMKAFISTFATDQNGKPVPGIIINEITDQARNDKWIPNLTAGQAEICFSFGVNPAMFGLGAPGGGAHAGGAGNGGSNIRESILAMGVASVMERQLCYAWWNFVCAYNGYDDDIELRTIDKVLTTLDTGAGTAKTIS